MNDWQWKTNQLRIDNSIPMCVEAQRAAPPAGGIAYTAVIKRLGTDYTENTVLN